MTIIALAEKGREFCYITRTAHKVSERKARKIADRLNELNYKTDANHHWWVYEVDRYDSAYDYASFQEFISGKRGITRRYN